MSTNALYKENHIHDSTQIENQAVASKLCWKITWMIMDQKRSARKFSEESKPNKKISPTPTLDRLL